MAASTKPPHAFLTFSELLRREAIEFYDKAGSFTFTWAKPTDVSPYHGDASRVARCNGTDIVATIPPDSTAPWRIGTHLAIYNVNSTMVTPAEGSGVTLHNLGPVPQYALVMFVKVGLNEWIQSNGIDPSVPRLVRFVIDGGGSAITTGAKKAYLTVPFSGVITKSRLLADQSGSIVVDVWKDTYANFPPVDADSITASAPPTLSGAQKSEDSTLTGWTTTINAGDILEVNVDSVATVTKVFLDLFVLAT